MKKLAWMIIFLGVNLLGVGNVHAASKDLRVAFLYHFPIGDAGWNYAHFLGQKKIEPTPGIKVMKLEGMEPSENSISILNHVAKSNDLVFLTSYSYIHFVKKIAKYHPNTIFMNCAGDQLLKNVGNYYAKMYQARYLTGMVAGAMTKTDIIGYVAAFPIPEVIRGINAFTLGVRKMNPDAEVRVAWTFHWNQPESEEKLAYQLLDMGADVLAQHQNSPFVQIAAEKRGKYSIGHNHNMKNYAPKAHLTASIWKWDGLYKSILEDVQKGKWKSRSIWWGLEHGVVDVAPISKKVPQRIRKLVLAEKEQLRKTDFIFTGPIKDQSGNIRVSPSTSLSNKDVYNMTWFVEGVLGSIHN